MVYPFSKKNKLRGPSRTFLLTVEEDSLEGLRGLAEERGVSVSQVMRDALRECLPKEPSSVDPIPVTEKEKPWWL